MDCRYEKVERKKHYDATKAPLTKQLFVIFGPWLVYFCNGLAFGIPTVMIPQIRQAANSTDAVSPEMASWLYSVFWYSALPWVVIICISTHYIGRKIPFGLVCLNMFACFNLLYFSTSVTQILIAEIMEGVTLASNTSLSTMIVTEYVSPKYRGLFLSIKTANFFWGIWVANAIGTFYHWRYIPLLGIFLSIGCITVIFWPESPQWLASKGMFGKCKMEHRWLRGTDTQSEKELEHLIQSQRDYTEARQDISYVRSAVKTIVRKAYYKPFLLALLLTTQYIVSGKLIFAMYAIDMIKKITASESTAYMGMLALDAVTIIGLYTGCVLSKVLKRRVLLFRACITGIAFLFIISFYLFLIELGLLIENNVVSLVLLTVFSVSICCGPITLVMAIAGEVIPLRYKSSITMFTMLNFLILGANFTKFYPLLTATVHMSGTFLTYAVMSATCCTALYIYLPETKDKTLQEIEDILVGQETRATASASKDISHNYFVNLNM